MSDTGEYPIGEYMEAKIEERGYPGFGLTRNGMQIALGNMHEAVRLGPGANMPMKMYHDGPIKDCADPGCKEYNEAMRSTSQADAMMAKNTEPVMYGMATYDPDIRVYPKGPVPAVNPAEVAAKPICEWCGNPLSGPLFHDCYEKRNGIKVGELDQDKILGMLGRPAVHMERYKPDAIRLEFEKIPNDQALRIVMSTLPKAMELYLQKSKDYGGNVMDRFNLGQKAAIPDMARKFGKLIDSIWNDQPLQFEQADEILMDLLGHILIILDQRCTDTNMDDLRRISE